MYSEQYRKLEYVWQKKTSPSFAALIHTQSDAPFPPYTISHQPWNGKKKSAAPKLIRISGAAPAMGSKRRTAIIVGIQNGIAHFTNCFPGTEGTLPSVATETNSNRRYPCAGPWLPAATPDAKQSTKHTRERMA